MSIVPSDRLAELEYEMQFVPGLVVRINKPFDRYTTDDLFVVTKINPKRVSIAPLGGQNGAGLNVPFRGLTIVEVDVARLQRELTTA